MSTTTTFIIFGCLIGLLALGMLVGALFSFRAQRRKLTGSASFVVPILLLIFGVMIACFAATIIGFYGLSYLTMQ